MSLAVLSIDLEARLASFEAGMGRAERMLDKLVDRSRNKFADIGSVFFGSLGASAFQQALGSVSRIVPELIDGVARFQDMAEATNASAEGLASMRTAADVSGVSVEQLADFMVKLTGNLAKTTDESQGTGKAIASLGLDVKAFRELRPDEQVLALADAFNGAKDSANKTAISLALFSRGGAQVLRFFKELEAEGGAQLRLTEAQILAADAWSDATARARSELRQQAELIALQTLPAMTAILNTATELAQRLFGVGDAAAQLSAEGAILDWAEGAALAVGTVVESITALIKLARAVGGSFQAVGADIALPFKVAGALGQVNTKSLPERLAEVGQALNEREATAREANQRYVELWNGDGTAITGAIRRNFAAVRASMEDETKRLAARARAVAKGNATALRDLPTFTLTDPKEDRTADRRRDQAQRELASLLEGIARRTEATKAELATGEKLSEVEAFAAEVRAKLAKETSNLSQAQRSQVDAALQAYLVDGRALEQQRDSTRLRSAESQALAQQVSERTAAVQRLVEENREIGLTAEQMDALKLQRLAEAIATQEQKIAVLELFDANAASLNQQRDMLEAMRDELQLREQAAARRRSIDQDVGRGVRDAATEFFKELETKGATAKRVMTDVLGSAADDITTSLRRGEFNVRRTVDTIIDELLRINVVKPALQWLMDLGGGVVSQALGFILGSSRGNAWADGRLVPFAGGGIFGPGGGLMTAPTLFPFANGRMGVGGEAGTEAVMPLVRGRGGRLGVQVEGSTGGNTYNSWTIAPQVGAGVTRGEVVALMQAWGLRLKAEILTTVNR